MAVADAAADADPYAPTRAPLPGQAREGGLQGLHSRVAAPILDDDDDDDAVMGDPPAAPSGVMRASAAAGPSPEASERKDVVAPLNGLARPPGIKAPDDVHSISSGQPSATPPDAGSDTESAMRRSTEPRSTGGQSATSSKKRAFRSPFARPSASPSSGQPTAASPESAGQAGSFSRMRGGLRRGSSAARNAAPPEPAADGTSRSGSRRGSGIANMLMPYGSRPEPAADGTSRSGSRRGSGIANMLMPYGSRRNSGMPRLQRAAAVTALPVRLHVYRLTSPVVDAALSAILGGGVYHSGVEIAGVEYAFGSHDEERTGVWMQEPSVLPPGFAGGHATHTTVIEVGVSKMTPRVLRRTLVPLMAEWPGNSYDTITRNCNHFSAALIQAVLRVDDGFEYIPDWVNRAANESEAIARRFTALTDRVTLRLNGLFAVPGLASSAERRVSTDAPGGMQVNFLQALPPTPRLSAGLSCIPKRDTLPNPSEQSALWAKRIAADYSRLTGNAMRTPSESAEAAGKRRQRRLLRVTGKTATVLPGVATHSEDPRGRSFFRRRQLGTLRVVRFMGKMRRAGRGKGEAGDATAEGGEVRAPSPLSPARPPVGGGVASGGVAAAGDAPGGDEAGSPGGRQPPVVTIAA